MIRLVNGIIAGFLFLVCRAMNAAFELKPHPATIFFYCVDWHSMVYIIVVLIAVVSCAIYNSRTQPLADTSNRIKGSKRAMTKEAFSPSRCLTGTK